MIAESVASSGVTNCEIVNAAAGKDDGTATLLVPRDDSGRAGFFEGFSGKSAHDKINVRVEPLDKILAGRADHTPMMLKIDVEGSESDVIAGGEKTIRAFRPPIMIELNPWSAKAAGRRITEIIDQLADLGYSSFSTADNFPQTVTRDALDTERQSNIVATP
jgi:FkbM family methyltransferase